MKPYTYEYGVISTSYCITLHATSDAFILFSHGKSYFLYYCISTYLGLSLVAVKNLEFFQGKTSHHNNNKAKVEDFSSIACP